MSGGPVVLITGASSGIGAAIAEELAKRGGYRIAIVARRTAELEAVASKAPAGVIFPITADISKRSEATTAVAKAVEHFGTVDVLINNAGRGCFILPSQLTEDVISDMINVNVNTALFCTQAVLPIFKEKKEGQIINVSSLLGRNAALAPVRSAYSASKYFLNGLTAAFQAEFGTEYPQILFQTFSPGVVATDFGNIASSGQHDSKSVPNAQDPAEVAVVLVDESIEQKKIEVYSRAMYKPMIRDALLKLVSE